MKNTFYLFDDDIRLTSLACCSQTNVGSIEYHLVFVCCYVVRTYCERSIGFCADFLGYFHIILEEGNWGVVIY